jgi:probable rRNA maturation factor
MTLCLRNRQRDCPIDLRLLRRVLRFALARLFSVPEYELCFHFVPASEMASLNEKFLNHMGPTDVITFDHSDCGQDLHGEIFICPEVAVAQAREFRTSWQEEIARYCVHGLLHLRGHDDVRAADRRKMKREEERLMKEIAQQFAVARLSRARLK